jgi:putative membrane protein insertion efficiency factor
MTQGQVAGFSDTDLLAVTNESTESGEPFVCPDHGGHEPRVTTWLQRRVQRSIIFYQRAREGRPSPCRFFPTCSAYALESVEVHGALRGGWLSLRRLLRCRPLGPSGVDLVPAGPSSTASCECNGAQAPALLTPTVVSSIQKKGG